MQSLRFVLILLAVASVLTPVHAEDAPQKIRVGIFDRPPFAMKDQKGQWDGLAVDLWEAISKKLNLSFEYVETPLDQIIPDLSEGKLDVVIGEVSVTLERRNAVNFTQPYLYDPAAVAFHKGSRYPSFMEIYGEILSQKRLILTLLIMMGTLLFFSVALWLCERGLQKTHFGGKAIHGLGSAIWFGAVTMTTVGYGDKTPQSLIGRFLALLWMFFSIVLVSAFTGIVASSITVSRINSTISSPAELLRYNNGVQQGSTGQAVMKHLGIPFESYETVETGLQALADKKITAFVGNEVSLRYEVNRYYKHTLRVASFSSMSVTFALAVRPGFPLYDQIDNALLEIRGSDKWKHDVKRWIGTDEGLDL